MLKKENRLLVLGSKTLNRIETPLFGINIGKNNLDLSRFSFIISKKVDKRATVRNKTKRKIRSVIEEILSKVEKGKDFTFYIKKNSIEATREEVFSEIKKALINK